MKHDDRSKQPDESIHQLSLGIPDELYRQLVALSRERGVPLNQASLQALRDGALALQSTASDTRRPAVPSTGAAWRVPPPPVGAERHLAHYEWAEDLSRALPLRFQRYVAQLLFDDERILFFLQRPPLRLRSRVPWSRGSAVNEGLLIVTDRMVMMIQDAIAPGPMFVDWGYDAWMTAVERVAEAHVEASADTAVIKIVCRAGRDREEQRIVFSRDQTEHLLEVAALLNRYGDETALMPARIYAEPTPQWEPPDEGATRLRIVGRGRDHVEESDIDPACAESGDTRFTLTGERLTFSNGRQNAELEVRSISSIRLWRAMTSCTLDVRVPTANSVANYSGAFQYPQSSPFLRIASRLRHGIGRPASG